MAWRTGVHLGTCRRLAVPSRFPCCDLLTRCSRGRPIRKTGKPTFVRPFGNTVPPVRRSVKKLSIFSRSAHQARRSCFRPRGPQSAAGRQTNGWAAPFPSRTVRRPSAEPPTLALRSRRLGASPRRNAPARHGTRTRVQAPRARSFRAAWSSPRTVAQFPFTTARASHKYRQMISGHLVHSAGLGGVERRWSTTFPFVAPGIAVRTAPKANSCTHDPCRAARGVPTVHMLGEAPLK